MKKKLISVLLTMSVVLQSTNMLAIDGVIQSTNQSETQMISGDIYVLTLESKSYKKNENTYSLTAAPIVIEGRNYLPVRFAAEELLEGQLIIDEVSGNLTIIKGEMKVQLAAGNKVIYIDGQPIELEAPIVSRQGITYMPIKVLNDYFNMTVSYDSQAKAITIKGPDKGINQKPIAAFEFGQNLYTEGQSVKVVSTSYDPDEHKLKDQMWCIIEDGQIRTDKELKNILGSKPKTGIYRIGLKVQDEYGLWSEWAYKELTILANEAPEITYFGTEKLSYAQGEKIEYQYFYNNETWEEVTNEKWTYRHAEEDKSKAILGKPDALFTEGEYIITLEIDDAFGNRSEVIETKVSITEEVLNKELSFRFTEGKIGDIIDNYQNFNYREYEDAVINSTSLVAGSTIMSDSPEEVTREGILYRDVINGKGRLLLHHINQFSDTSVASGTKRLVVVAENKTEQPVTFTLSNKTIRGPVTDILYLGQKLLYDYLIGCEDETITLQPGEKQYIYDSTTKWKQGTCISGLMDVETTGDVTFTMASVSANSNLNTMNNMELFLQAVHPRGTFEGTGITYNLQLDASKPTKLVLGSGDDEWVKGYDALLHNVAYNKGNYGISYYITMTATEDMGIILNPRANVFRGAIKWVGDGVYNAPHTGTIYNNTAKAVSLGTIKAGETKTLEYMLPNGSAAPVVLGFIPSSYWDN